MSKTKINFDNVGEVAKVIEDYLEQDTPTIIAAWEELVGVERAMKIVKMLNGDQSLAEDLAAMAECYCIAGYLLAESHFNKK